MKQAMFLLLAFVALTLAVGCGNESASETETPEVAAVAVDNSAEPVAADLVLVSYLHGNRRCATCEKLEKYAQATLTDRFGEQLETGSLVWRTANFESEGNEYLVDKYELFSQSLILSKMAGGEELEWKKLDKIWDLVGDEAAYTEYVQSELAAFMESSEE